MKTASAFFLNCRLCLGILAVLSLLTATPAHAGLTFELHLVNFEEGQAYKFFTPLYTNSTGPAPAFGTYFISSPLYAPPPLTNGSWREIQITTNGAVTLDGRENPCPDFDSLMAQITNGAWTIVFTNEVTTNTYTFTVSASGITSNMLPATIITYPTFNELDVPNQPTLTWLGPTNWPAFNNTYLYNYDSSFFQYASSVATQEEWTVPVTIPDGVNCTLRLQYITNNTPLLFNISTPRDAHSNPLPGWVPTDLLETGDSLSFAITNPPVAGAHLVAHYAFDNMANPGQDTSGNGYDLDFNGGDGVVVTNDAVSGGGAAWFDGSSFFTYNNPPTNVLNTLAGDFSISFWIKTTENDGNEGGDAWAGAGIVAADVPGLYNDLVPAALDGGEIGFNTGGPSGDDTVNSFADINDGNYHHVVITRTESTGEKDIYIDGVLNNSDFATLNPLSDPRTLAVGCAVDASQSDPNKVNPNQFFQGTLDDMQIYAGVVNSNQVAFLYNNPGAAIGRSHVNGLVAHYSFDDSGRLGADSSGNAYDLNYNGAPFGGGVASSADATAGGGAAYFDGGSFFSYLSTPGAVLSTLAGDFSLSFWIKTSQTYGSDGEPAYFGAGIVSADIPGQYNDIIPAALDGGEIGFNTGPDDDTVNSTTDINDGNYHHVVITREQSTGEKRIYIDGALNNSDSAGTSLLNDPKLVAIGCAIDASQSDPASASPGQFFNGWLDDIQLYSRVLGSDEVAFLHENPGSTAAPPDFNTALNTTNLGWITSGDSSWFIETTNSVDGMAAQSGIVTNNQSSTLYLTVTGPGTVTFDWACQDSGANFDYEAYYDDSINNDQADLDFNAPWEQNSYHIPAGQHTLYWTAFASGDNDPTEAGFLDNVTYVPDTMPVITLNPFDQTNYPGYPVWLSADAISTPEASWQWYKVGSGAIPGGTSSDFVPTNSGTAGVAGHYYAIASTDVGSAITTTAAVSFVSAPLPPDWSRAFKSPFFAVDPENQTNRDFYYGCIVDANSNIYTAAEFGGAMTIGSQTLVSGPGGDAAAVVKQTPAGSAIWAAGITNEGAGSSFAECVAAAPGGGVYVAGNYSGANWLGTNELTDAGGGDIFLARFDAGGSNVWLKTFGSSDPDFMLINSLVSDAAGNVSFSALFGAGPLAIGSSNYMVIGQQCIVAQLDQNGNVRWSQMPSGFVQYLAYGAGRLYASLTTETTDGTTNVAIGGISNLTDRAWALACLNETNGQAIWVRNVGGPVGGADGNPYATGAQDDTPRIAVAGTNVFITGAAYGSTATFGPLAVNFALPRGQYFARYDTNGNPQIATAYGSVTTTPLAAVANANGEVYVSGDFDTYSFFGSDLLAGPATPKLFTSGFGQAFLAKFDANGNPLWAREAISPAWVNFLGIALASDGVWASGWSVSTNTMTGYTPTAFGTNYVYGDVRIIVSGGGGIGSIFFIGLPGGVLAKITDASGVALPVTLVNPQDDGVNFQLSFQSQSGFMHDVLYTTDLTNAMWQTYSNVPGDGTMKTIPVPLSIFGPSPQGFIRVSTH